METDFTPYQSLFGGVLIGLSAVMLMAFNGRIAGMTGILGGILPPYAKGNGWQIAFLIGAIAFVRSSVHSSPSPIQSSSSSLPATATEVESTAAAAS